MSTMVDAGIGDAPLDGMAIIDCGLEALCQLEVLGREEADAPEDFGSSLETLLIKWDLIGERTFSSTLLGDPAVSFALFS